MSDATAGTAGTAGTDGLRIRQAARALVVDPDWRVLLVRFEFCDGTRWALPGGGLEPGETHVEALVRELEEEVGLAKAEIGPQIWNRLHVIPFEDGCWDGQHERIYLVRSQPFEPNPRLTWAELRAEHVVDMRWWRDDELTDGLPFVPRSLASRLTALRRDGPPLSPLDIGI